MTTTMKAMVTIIIITMSIDVVRIVSSPLAGERDEALQARRRVRGYPHGYDPFISPSPASTWCHRLLPRREKGTNLT